MADIAGTLGDDVLLGTLEDDTITGLDGADVLIGDAGDDFLDGDAGADLLVSGGGADTILGDGGVDLFMLERGDRVSGGTDADTFFVLPGFAETEVVIDAGPEQHRFTAEIAATPGQQGFGLMFRADLASDHGMLFVFEREQPIEFWMRNTFIPLDMLFVDALGSIVRVAENTTPLSDEPIPSGEPVFAVLELEAGTAAALGIGIGDRALHPIFGAEDSVLGADGDDPHASGDTIIEDFGRGEDVISLQFFDQLTFADLDANGDGALDDSDTHVSVDDGATTIDLAPLAPDPMTPYALTVVGVTGLIAADFAFVDAVV